MNASTKRIFGINERIFSKNGYNYLNLFHYSLFKIHIVDENFDINNISQSQPAEIPLFQNIKVVEEFGTKGYLYITSNQINFFGQLDHYTLNNNKIKNGFLFNMEYVNFQEKTYSLLFEFEILNCSKWQYRGIRYNM